MSFCKLKDELANDSPGSVSCAMFYQVHAWAVQVNSLQGVIDNWLPLQELWDECLATKLQSEVLLV